MLVNALDHMIAGGAIVKPNQLGRPSYYYNSSSKRYVPKAVASAATKYNQFQIAYAGYNTANQAIQKNASSPQWLQQVSAATSAAGSSLGAANNKRVTNIVEHATEAEEKEYDPQKFLQYTSTKFTGATGKLEGSTKGRSLSDSEMRKLHEMFCLWSTDGINAAKTLDNFNRFYALYPEMEMPQNLKMYVIFTRPMMNIYSNITTRALVRDNVNLVEMDKTCPEMLKMLSEDYSSMHDFMPYLQSRAVSMQLTDYQIGSSEYGVPFYNYKYSYPTVTNTSQTGGTVDVTFREDSMLRITKTFRFWIYYMDCVNKGILVPKQTFINDYTYDYMCSIYQFICDPTSEWVLWYSKYTGCFPTSVPISNFSFSLGDSPDNKVNIGFNYIRVEHMDPSILTDFSANVHATGTNYLDLRDEDFDVPAPSLSACPVLVRAGNKTLLKWLPMEEGPSTGIVMSDGQPFDPSRMSNINDFAKAKDGGKMSSRSGGVDPYGDAYKSILEDAKSYDLLERQYGALQGLENNLRLKQSAPLGLTETSTLDKFRMYNSAVPHRI